MKYTWKQKLEAVRLYAWSGTYDYPKECKSRARKRSYANQVKFWYSVYLAKGAEPIGIVSGIEHLHSRDSNNGIHIACPSIEVSLLPSARIEYRSYRYRPFPFQQPDDPLDRPIAYAQLLGEEGNLYRAFFAMHPDVVRDN